MQIRADLEKKQTKSAYFSLSYFIKRVDHLELNGGMNFNIFAIKIRAQFPGRWNASKFASVSLPYIIAGPN
jgi:hypothetical protein